MKNTNTCTRSFADSCKIIKFGSNEKATRNAKTAFENFLNVFKRKAPIVKMGRKLKQANYYKASRLINTLPLAPIFVSLTISFKTYRL